MRGPEWIQRVSGTRQADAALGDTLQGACLRLVMGPLRSQGPHWGHQSR